LKERQREEPFYTKKLNESFVSSQDYVEFRIEKCKTKVSQEVVGIDQVKTVLDYGGDRGQFIPRFTPEQRSYVFEISDHKTVADVTSIKDSSQLKQSKPDLVIISHVLEHVSEPRELLHEIFSQLAHENTFIYIEVPLDTPITRRTSSSNWNFRLQSFYSHHPFVSTIFDSVAKILLKTVHLDLPIKPFRQSEHINFFSEESLITLMKENDYSKVGNLDTYEYQISMTLKSSCLVGVFRRS
jgi:hypothetical protein